MFLPLHPQRLESRLGPTLSTYSKSEPRDERVASGRGAAVLCGGWSPRVRGWRGPGGGALTPPALDQPPRPGRERERGSPSGPSREARRGDRQVLPPLHRPRVRDTPGGTNINCEKLMAIIKRQGEMGMGLFCGS